MPLVFAAAALAWRRWRLAAALVLVVPLKLVLEQVAKPLVQRQRPGTTVPDAILRGGAARRAELHLRARHYHFRDRRLLVLVLPRWWGLPRSCWQPATRWRGCTWGAHNLLDVVGGAAIGLMIAAGLDLILDVARHRERGPPGQSTPAHEDRAT